MKPKTVIHFAMVLWFVGFYIGIILTNVYIIVGSTVLSIVLWAGASRFYRPLRSAKVPDSVARATDAVMQYASALRKFTTMILVIAVVLLVFDRLASFGIAEFSEAMISLAGFSAISLISLFITSTRERFLRFAPVGYGVLAVSMVVGMFMFEADYKMLAVLFLLPLAWPHLKSQFSKGEAASRDVLAAGQMLSLLPLLIGMIAVTIVVIKGV